MAAFAAELGLFVLLEAFDEQDIAMAAEVAATWRGVRDGCLIGINSRDLVTLQVVPQRLEALEVPGQEWRRTRERTGREAIPFVEIDGRPEMIPGWHEDAPGRWDENIFLAAVARVGNG